MATELERAYQQIDYLLQTLEVTVKELGLERKSLELACEHVLPASIKIVDPQFSIEITNNNVILLCDYFRNKAKK